MQELTDIGAMVPEGRSMSDRVMREVETMIATGQLAAGSRISEQSIAETLGVSRGPVREAFRSLTQAGLLVSHRNRGVVVREISREELLDLYQIRAALEAEIAAAAVPHLGPEFFDALDEVLRDMRASVEEDAAGSYFAANVQFDVLLIAACPNRRLREVYRSIVRQMQLVRRERLKHREDMLRSLSEHTELRRVLGSGDAAAVRTAFHSHIMRARDRIAAG